MKKVISLILLFVIMITLYRYKTCMQEVSKNNTKEKFEEECPNVGFKNIYNKIEHTGFGYNSDFRDNTTIMTPMLSMNGPTRFKELVVIKDSDVSFKNAAFNNDIYLNKDKGSHLTFKSRHGDDLFFNEEINQTIHLNFDNMNNILQDSYCSDRLVNGVCQGDWVSGNYRGKWEDGNFVVTDLFTEFLSPPEHQCVVHDATEKRDVRVNDKDACIYNMWKAVRDGVDPIDNKICDCCCPDDIPSFKLAQVKFIEMTGKSFGPFVAEANMNQNVIINADLVISDIILNKTSDTLVPVLNFFNHDASSVVTSFGKDQFGDENTFTTIPFKRINNYIPNVIHLITYSSDKKKIYAIPNDEHKGDSFKPKKDDDYKEMSESSAWKIQRVENTLDEFYLQNAKNTSEYVYYKQEEKGRFNRGNIYNKSPFKFIWEIVDNLYTGKFSIMCINLYDVSVRINNDWQIVTRSREVLMFMNDSDDLRFKEEKDFKDDITQKLWWYNYDDNGTSRSSTDLAINSFNFSIQS
uniref:Uncharacterized protein n=1 Tax=viral metagenome TaxID=1070528 RepID=A0A6C0BPV0_9ZZZZ